MATTLQGVAPGVVRSEARKAYPQSSLRFDWANAGLAALWLSGLYIDGWAHNHGKVDNTFFTPWHAILYSTFGLIGIFLTLTLMSNLRRGYTLRRALPRGYMLSMLGVLIFAFGGVFDFIWHSLFGFEANTEALFSPAHLLLALGFVLVQSGPLRALYARIPAQSRPAWQQIGPLVISLTFTVAVLAFFTQFAHPLVYETAAVKGRTDFGLQGLGLSSILLQCALMIAPVLWLVRRWRLPFGALMMLIIVPGALVTVFRDSYSLLPGVVVASLIAEALYAWLKPSAERPTQFALFGFLVPIVFYGFYFLSVQLTYGIGWSIHLWAGAILMAAVVGLFLSFLMVWPQSEVSEAEAV